MPGQTTSSTSSLTTRLSGVTISRMSFSMLCLYAGLLGPLEHHVDAADHVEHLLRYRVVVAGDDALEALDRIRQGDVLAGGARKGLGHEERLGEEPLYLPRA